MTTFAELGLSPKILAAVEAAGYTTPTPIQAGAIPHVLERKDVLGIAQTGTGKTASFVLPMLHLLEKGRARARMPRTLILEPTRELAAQVEENFVKYGVNHRINVSLLIGGVSFDEQERKLQRGADVLIATPGRLLDHFERGKLLLTGVEILVIDEADRMLDMGFIPDIERICKLIPFTRQTLFFSATMPAEITKLTEQFLHSPARVEVAKASSTAKTVTQRLVKSAKKPWDKRAVLRDLIVAESAELKNAIVFCNRKMDVSELFRSLVKHGFDAGALHGDMDQRARMAMLANFKEGNLKILVASDVAARGLDIPDVSHVFNFDVPIHAEDYVHRIGRTGRAGRSGKAFTLVTPSDTKHLDAIEKMVGEKIEWMDGDLSTLPPVEETEDNTRRGRNSRGKNGKKPRDKDSREKDHKEKQAQSSSQAQSPSQAQAHSGIAEEKTTAAPQPVVVDISALNAPQPVLPDNVSIGTPAQQEPVRPITHKNGHEDRRPHHSQNNTQSSQNNNNNKRHRRDFDDDPSPLGFGDDIPAFMLIPINI